MLQRDTQTVLIMENQPITTQLQTASKPSTVQRRSSGSVRIAFLDRKGAVAELSEQAQALVLRDPRVADVGLFGSLARGQALPSSDADVLIALREHPEQRWFDRMPEYGAAFEHTALPVETFPYTLDELTRLSAHPGFIRTAMRELLHLSGDAYVWRRLQREAQRTLKAES